jgi:NADH-quinone oxidoreductase subunit L
LGGALNVTGSFSTWLSHTLGGPAGPGAFNFLVASISTILALAAIGLAYYLYGQKFQEQQKQPVESRPVDPLQPYLGPVFTGIQHKWWVDELYDWLILRRYVALAHFLAQVVDERFWHDWFHETAIYKSYLWLTGFLARPVDLGIIDGVGNGLASVSQRLAGFVRRIQNGFVRSYAMWVFAGLVVILAYLIFRNL